MIGQALAGYAASYPDHPAVEYAERSISYQELHETIRRRRRQLHAALGPFFQKQVAFALQDPLEQLYMFYAVVSGGGIAVPVDETLSGTATASLLSSSPASCFITDESKAAALPVSSFLLADIMSADVKPDAPAACCEETDLFYGACTSGSSGQPKICMRNHRSWLKSFEADGQLFPFQERERVLMTGKLTHSLFLYGTVRMLEHGHTIVLPGRYSPRTLGRLLSDDQITVLYAVPTMLRWLVNRSLSPFSSVRLIITGGEKWFPGDNQQTFACFPAADLYEFYGSAETSFISALNHRREQVSGSCTGRLFPMVEAVSSGTSGELTVTSPFLFSGYAGDHSFQERQSYATGDIGYVDPHGFLYITGRQSGKMVSRGRTIYAEEIEQVLMTHPAVAEAVVFGVHDAFQGENVTALYTGNAAANAVRAYCRQHLPAYKTPACLQVESLPKLSSGKIDRPGAQTYYEAIQEGER